MNTVNEFDPTIDDKHDSQVDYPNRDRLLRLSANRRGRREPYTGGRRISSSTASKQTHFAPRSNLPSSPSIFITVDAHRMLSRCELTIDEVLLRHGKIEDESQQPEDRRNYSATACGGGTLFSLPMRRRSPIKIARLFVITDEDIDFTCVALAKEYGL